jgi:hypothetical protein
MSRADRVALDDLDRIIRLIDDLRRNYTAAVAMAEDVSLGGGVEGPSSGKGSHADPTATTALDGRRQRRRGSVKRSRKDIGIALRHLQSAVYAAASAANDD